MEALQNILLIIHIIVAILIVITVLLQPSGGGDGLVTTGGVGNFMSARSAASFLSKFTLILAVIFMGNTLALGIIANKKSQANSIVNQLIEEQQEDNTEVPLAE